MTASPEPRMTPAIAITGMACRYPDARSPAELWENVLAQRRAFRRIPAERLRLEDYWASDRSLADRIYSTQAALIEGWEFDRARFKVADSTFRAADLAHWLALEVGTQALEDAGFPDGAGLPRETSGAIVGNTLTGEFSRADALRLRWPYVRRVVAAELERSAMDAEGRAALLGRIETAYKLPFAAAGEETLAGSLSNTIAGRICNHFDLKGGGYTVDGAGAASLLAVITACRALEAGDLDVALAGGVDLSLDPFELVGFARAGALAEDEMRVYDTHAQGFWPGEGCGFVVLMRETDALAQGRRIYGTIRGWGMSSDGRGGLTRPEVEGHALAVARAYRRAGFGPHTVAYFEGDGTGTMAGDGTELQVLSRARREAGASPAAAIGSIKANIGHTKAAAGIAGLLKATLALHHQLLPPTTGCEQPRAEFTGTDPALRVLAEGQPWPGDPSPRAAVSAMGFGGFNTHVVLEGAPERREPISARTRRLLDSRQDAELFLFGASTRTALALQLERVAGYATRLSRSELSDLAAALATALGPADVRAAVVASRPEELGRSLATLMAWVADGVGVRVDPEARIAFSEGGRAPRIGFLFSGQASPVRTLGGAWARRFEVVRSAYRDAALPDPGAVAGTAIEQPAIVTSSLAALAVLDELGIEAAVAAGHGLGEITALHWAGAIPRGALLELVRVRGRAMMNTTGPPSGMLGIAADATAVASLLEGTPVVIAGFDLPRQTVVSGESTAIELVAARAHERRWHAERLPASHAFHSPFMEPAAAELEEQLERTPLEPLRRLVASTITGGLLDARVDVPTLLDLQLTCPVRFVDAVRAMGELDLVVEVGPGRVLTELASRLLPCPAVALDASGGSLSGLLAAAGAAFALGADLRHAALFEGRFTRPFELDWSPTFLVNPCERSPAPRNEPAEALTTPAVGPGEIPLLRFLERPRVHSPGLELVVEADLSPRTDPYLDDHVFEGTRLLPAVMGLEAMAQAAMALAGTDLAPTFESIRFDHPVAIADGGTTIRLAALVREPGVIDVAVRSDETGFEIDHFRATCLTGADPHHPGTAEAGPRPGAPDPAARPAIDPARDLYGGILFQGGRFRRLAGYHRLSASACEAELSPGQAVEWFGRHLPTRLVLGDPAARDGAIHAVQACIPHATLFPMAVDRLRPGLAPGQEPRLVEAREVAQDGGTLQYDIDLRDAAGSLCESWQGLRLKIVGRAMPQGPWPAPLLAPYLERRVRELLPGASVSVAVVESGRRGREKRSDAAIGMALGRRVTVRRQPDGKPTVDGEHVSAAHSGRLTFAVTGSGPVGCDVEPIAHRDEPGWCALVGTEGWSLAAHVAGTVGEAIDASATRVWSAMECARKAGAAPGPFRLGPCTSDGWVVLEAEGIAAATTVSRVQGSEDPLLFAVLVSPGPQHASL